MTAAELLVAAVACWVVAVALRLARPRRRRPCAPGERLARLRAIERRR